MQPYPRAVAFATKHGLPTRPEATRVTETQVYLPGHRTLMYLATMPGLWVRTAEDVRFGQETARLDWFRYAEAIEHANALVARYAVEVAKSAMKARTLLATARITADAMTVMELRAQARAAVLEGHAHRGRLAWLQAEIVAHPRPGSVRLPKRPYVRRAA